MSQTAHQDLERGNDVVDGPPDQPRSMPSQPPQSSQEEMNYGDSSWPLYSMYSKISQEGDNKVAEFHQKSTDGILIFTGLFSATVAALLAVSIPDLKPDPQDTSAFYLENIYQLFANSNVSERSITSTLVMPPAFSPPRYVVWVNSLWLLALLISITGALSATLRERWSLRYIMITQSKDFTPERRARVHAMLMKSENGRFNFQDNSAIIFCLHFSVFLFMVGALVYFFNISHAIFGTLVWWIAIVTICYALLTVMPIFYPDELLYTPFSSLVLRTYLGFPYAASHVCSWIKPLRHLADATKKHYRETRDRYSDGFFEGKTKSAEEAASKPSSEIDTEVLERTMLVLNEDHALNAFFDTIPGFCDSKLVQKPLHSRVMTKLEQSLDGFLDRSFSSHLVTESVKRDRLITCLNAAHSALGPPAVSKILGDFFKRPRDEALKSVAIGHSLRPWGHNSDDLIRSNARTIIACIIARVQNRDEQWTVLVKEVYGVPDGAFRDYIAHGDSVLLAILISIAREGLRTGRSERGVLESLSQLDICNTVVELRRNFCTLWNEIVQEARSEGASDTPTEILSGIYRLFVPLHQGTDSSPTQFSASADSNNDLDINLSPTSSYPSCNVPSHRPYSTAHGPATSLPTVPPPIQRSNSPEVLPYPHSASQTPLAVSPEVGTENTMSGNADTFVVSGTAHSADPIPGSTSGSDPARRQVEETKIIPVPVTFGSLPTDIPILAPSHTTVPAVLPLSMASAVTPLDYAPHTPGTPPSTLTAAALSISPHVTTVSGQYPGVSVGTTGTQDDNLDPYHPLPREEHPQPPPGDVTGL